MHISIARGTLFTDVAVCRVESAAGPSIDLWLHYDSGKADGSVAERRTVLGYGWTHKYNIFLVDESPEVFLSDAKGRMTRFRQQNGSYVADPGETHELTQKPLPSLTNILLFPFSSYLCVYFSIKIGKINIENYFQVLFLFIFSLALKACSKSISNRLAIAQR